MKFNAYELEYTPDDCTEPRPQKSVSIIETYSSVQFFDWGMILPGVKISIAWDAMSAEEFYALDAIYAQNGAVTWESGIQGKTYSVIIAAFDGVLINGSDASPNREKVQMILYILNEVKT